jgi:hypothetical protein
VRENSHISGYSTQSKIAGSGERKMMKEKRNGESPSRFLNASHLLGSFGSKGKTKVNEKKEKKKKKRVE